MDPFEKFFVASGSHFYSVKVNFGSNTVAVDPLGYFIDTPGPPFSSVHVFLCIPLLDTDITLNPIQYVRLI